MNEDRTTECLTAEQIEALAIGTLDLDTRQRLQAHVDQCARCQDLLEQVKDEEALAGELRNLPIAIPSVESTMDATEMPVRSSSGEHPGRQVSIPGYEIDHELSQGGQGVVYQALQLSTKRKVALKVLLEGRFASHAARRRFEREVELAASLSHPNIVAIFDSGETPDGRQFYAMDFVQGLPLTRYVRENELSLDDALQLFSKICAAIQFAHQRGVIHRDLKPSNILVDGSGEPRVLDFGLAKQIDGEEQSLVSLTGQIVGTLPYMSPEQARGLSSEIDTRTDIYALGVILYEMLTGHYPYPVVGQMADVLRHIAETVPTPPSRSWENGTGVHQRSATRRQVSRCPINDEVQTIVLKLLSKERERRYQSAGEIASDIGRYLAGDPIEAKRASTWYVLRKLAARHAYASVITCALIVSLLSFSGISFYFWQESDRALAEVRKKDAFAEGQTQHIAYLHGDVSARLRQMALGWFLLEWNADRIERARSIQAMIPAETPERLATTYLLDDDASVQALEHLNSESKPLAYFSVGERYLKQGRADDAHRAFKQCIESGADEWLTASSHARLGQVKAPP